MNDTAPAIAPRPPPAAPGEPVHVLLLTAHAEAVRRQYVDGLRAAFPRLAVESADDPARVDGSISDVQVLVTQGGSLTDTVLARARKLRWIHALTSGTDGIDDLPSLRPDVLLTSTRGIHGAAVSEAALLAMLALSRDFPRCCANQQRQAWQRGTPRLLEGKTVGIFGVGLIGSALAPRCRALGMRVLGVDRTRREAPGVERIVAWRDAATVLPELDFVVLLVPSAPATRGLVDADFLAALKPGAFLVNLGRGDVVDEAALVRALAARRLAGAALDVFRQEPLPPGHPFWSLDNVIVTPHLGGAFDEYPRRALPILAENMRRFLAGDTAHLINVVHPRERPAA